MVIIIDAYKSTIFIVLYNLFNVEILNILSTVYFIRIFHQKPTCATNAVSCDTSEKNESL